MTIHKIIKEARIKRGLTLRELGKIIDVGETQISAWEAGRRNPSADTLRKYVQADLITPSEALGIHYD